MRFALGGKVLVGVDMLDVALPGQAKSHILLAQVVEAFVLVFVEGDARGAFGLEGGFEAGLDAVEEELVLFRDFGVDLVEEYVEAEVLFVREGYPVLGDKVEERGDEAATPAGRLDGSGREVRMRVKKRSGRGAEAAPMG